MADNAKRIAMTAKKRQTMEPRTQLVEDQWSLKLIPPWTPVKAEAGKSGVEAGMWGRTYRFANAPLPTSIITAGEEILAAPIRLVGQVSGRPIEWKRGGTCIYSKNDADVVVSGWQAGDDLIVNSTTRVEFDGMMRVDFVVMPQNNTTPKIERLWLEAPLKHAKAGLYHFWPGAWGADAAKNSGAVPAAGLNLPFKPFVWLGWEEGGLGWFAESDKNWQPQDVKQPIEVAVNGDQTILRLHLLDSAPPRLPVTYTIGFQATPVKPWRQDFHELRVCHGASYGMETRPFKPDAKETALDHAAKLGVKTLVFHESWTPIQDYPFTTQEKELKDLVAACHRRDIKLLLYFGFSFSSMAPEWGTMSDEVLVKGPAGELPNADGYYRQPEQRDYTVCYNNRWRDILLNGIARSLDRYGFDGVYLDGTIEPWACANEKHGCGYRAADGTLHATYPIFAVRKLMHGLAAVVHARGGLVNAHQSTCCATPTLAFADSYWDGEQFSCWEGGQCTGVNDVMQKMPLAAFRAEFMGRNHGVPAEFLVYEKPPQWTFDHALAFTMLHDVRVRPIMRSDANEFCELEKMAPIWDAMTRFGVSKAEWHPYWETKPLAAVPSENIKTSLYLGGGKKTGGGRALLIVSNLGPEKATAQVTLDLKRLRLRGSGAIAKDALTGETLKLDGNRLAVPLPAMRMRMVWVE